MMIDDLTNAVRLLFSRDATFTLEEIMEEAPEVRQVRVPDLGHIVVDRPLPIFAEMGQHALFGFNRDHQIVGIQYRMHHDADWSAKAEFAAAAPLLQAKCHGMVRRHHDWERRDRLEVESCMWRPSFHERVTLKREQLKLRGKQRMVSITRTFDQPAAGRGLVRGLEDLFS